MKKEDITELEYGLSKLIDIVEILLKRQEEEINKQWKKKVMKLIRLYGVPECDNLNHNKRHQHKSHEPCPVEKEINDIIKTLK